MRDGRDKVPGAGPLRRLWMGITLAVAAQAATAGPAGDQDPSRWLERMPVATRTLNYEGVFVYRHSGGMETIRVIHRVVDGKEQERLTSLDGDRREVLRDPERVTCIWSDNKSVLVDESRRRGLLGSALFQADDRLRQHYRLEMGGHARIAGRAAQEVRVAPVDEFRYGYRLWLDVGSGLLLKAQLLDEKAAVLEELLFTRIELPEEIPDNVLEPEVASEGFDRHTNAGPPVPAPKAAPPQWAVSWVPAGFHQTGYSREPLVDGQAPVDHLVFSDGLAAFSVYLERITGERSPFEGLSQMGALAAYGKRIGEFQVTVVGDVPRVTVDRVGRSVQRR